MRLFHIFFIKAKKDVLDLKCLCFSRKKKSRDSLDSFQGQCHFFVGFDLADMFVGEKKQQHKLSPSFPCGFATHF